MKNAKESTRVSLSIFLFTAALLLEHVLSYAVISRFFAVRKIKTEGVLRMLLWLVPLFYMAVLSIHYAMLQNFVQSFQLVRLIAKPMLLLLMCICLYYLTTGGEIGLYVCVLLFWQLTFDAGRRLYGRLFRDISAGAAGTGLQI